MKSLLRSAMATVTYQLAENEEILNRSHKVVMGALLAFGVLAATPGQAYAQDWTRYIGAAASAAGAAIGAKVDSKNPWAGAAVGTAIGHAVGEYAQHGEIRNPEVAGAGIGGVVGRVVTKNNAGTALGALGGAVAGSMVGSDAREEAKMRAAAGQRSNGGGQWSNGNGNGNSGWNHASTRTQQQAGPQFVNSGHIDLSESPKTANNLAIAKENMFKYRERMQSAINDFSEAQETPNNFDGRNKAAAKLDLAQRNYAASETEYIHVRNVIASKGFNVSEVDHEVAQRLTNGQLKNQRNVDYNYNSNQRGMRASAY